jgi:hypothetical protein
MTVLPTSRYERTLAAIFLACGAALAAGLAYGALLVPPPLRTPRSVALATACCPWDAEVQVWIDRNEDGIRQPGEEPLEGVAVRASGYFDAHQRRTDPTGRASFSIKGRCGGNEERRVTAEIPSGYRPTTPLTSRAEGRHGFGFRSTID